MACSLRTNGRGPQRACQPRSTPHRARPAAPGNPAGTQQAAGPHRDVPAPARSRQARRPAKRRNGASPAGPGRLAGKITRLWAQMHAQVGNPHCVGHSAARSALSGSAERLRCMPRRPAVSQVASAAVHAGRVAVATALGPAGPCSVSLRPSTAGQGVIYRGAKAAASRARPAVGEYPQMHSVSPEGDSLVTDQLAFRELSRKSAQIFGLTRLGRWLGLPWLNRRCQLPDRGGSTMCVSMLSHPARTQTTIVVLAIRMPANF
jgi:hypothetical protein